MIVCVPVIVALAGGYLLPQLDPRLYPVSMTGLRGFAKYLAGDDGAAARLYRADLADRVSLQGPPWVTAFVSGDLETAERLVRQDVEKAPRQTRRTSSRLPR